LDGTSEELFVFLFHVSWALQATRSLVSCDLSTPKTLVVSVFK